MQHENQEETQPEAANPAPQEEATSETAKEESTDENVSTEAQNDATETPEAATEEAADVEAAVVEPATEESAAVESAAEETPNEEPAAAEAEAATEATAETPAADAADETAAAEATSDQADAPSEATATEAAPEATDAAPAEAASTDAAPAEQGEMDDENMSFEALLEQYDKFPEFKPGDLVEGSVLSTGDQEVLLDIGARVEGTIPAAELRNAEGEFTVTNGDKLKVMILRYNPDAQYIPLSFERARVSAVWDHIEEIADKEHKLTGKVIEKVKGGFIVDVGVRAFLPTSQASLRPQKDMQDLLGHELDFTILKIQRRRGNLILSRRDILAKELDSKKQELFTKLQEGAVLSGAVKNITDYGVFIDLGGLDGLLHITDMSWGRVTHPKDMVELGQEIEVKVLRFDPEKEKVSLGLKQCTPDPWLAAAERYAPGASVTGKVLNLTSYGAFIELEAGVEGMIHVSEMSWTKKVRNPAQVMTKGADVECRVIDLDTENRRVSLSLKQNEDNPWDSLAERFPVGSKVSGKVRNITDFGAFIEIEDGIDGLVHISDFAWGERNANPNDYVKKGEEIEVVILAVDTDNHKVSLGMKQLQADPWIEFTNNYKQDRIIKAPVSKVTEFGVFLKLTDHVEGLIRNNELDLAQGTKASDKFEEGQEVQALVTRINNRDRKVDLSIRKMEMHQERQAVREYTKNNDTGGATMGDVMGDLRNLLK